ncbi:hypothetical protein TIFTF001_001414 [Ficus carica]|uniref:Uncharacterized protein n=1 Tax=Ficus carica TaxID=3494 RepID=A0AA88CM05_FICCA|nr:hypothetical protein TIFTF001_001414 [Ficus carica]
MEPSSLREKVGEEGGGGGSRRPLDHVVSDLNKCRLRRGSLASSSDDRRQIYSRGGGASLCRRNPQRKPISDDLARWVSKTRGQEARSFALEGLDSSLATEGAHL